MLNKTDTLKPNVLSVPGPPEIVKKPRDKPYILMYLGNLKITNMKKLRYDYE